MSISKKIASLIDSFTTYNFVVVRAGVVIRTGSNLRDFKLAKDNLHLHHVVPVKKDGAPLNVGDKAVIWDGEAIFRDHAWHAISRELRRISMNDKSFLEIFNKEENFLKDATWDLWRTRDLDHAVGTVFHRIAKINQNRKMLGIQSRAC